MPAWRPVTLMFAVAGLAGCDLASMTAPEEPDPGPVLTASWSIGAWAVTASVQGQRYYEDGRTERHGGTCDETAQLNVSEHHSSGALTWSLDRMVSCTTPDTTMTGPHHHADTWERFAWAVVSGDSIRVTTPHLLFFLQDGRLPCEYRGVVTHTVPARIQGTVTCRALPLGPWPGPSFRYVGAWAAVRQ